MKDNSEELLQTRHPRCLEQKLKLFGFELGDLFITTCIFSILNFLLGDLPFASLISWGVSASFALILYLGKRGKPNNYLIHKLRFTFSPGVYSAWKNQQIKDLS